MSKLLTSFILASLVISFLPSLQRPAQAQGTNSPCGFYECGTCPRGYGCGFDGLQCCCEEACTCNCSANQCSTDSGWNASCPGSLTCCGLQPTHAPNNATGYHIGAIGVQPQAQCSAFGYAYDPDDPNAGLFIRVLNQSQSGQVIAGPLLADRPQPTSACPDGTCGFNPNLYSVMPKNVPQNIKVQVGDLDAPNWIDLINTPRTLQCTDTTCSLNVSPSTTCSNLPTAFTVSATGTGIQSVQAYWYNLTSGLGPSLFYSGPPNGAGVVTFPDNAQYRVFCRAFAQNNSNCYADCGQIGGNCSYPPCPSATSSHTVIVNSCSGPTPTLTPTPASCTTQAPSVPTLTTPSVPSPGSQFVGNVTLDWEDTLPSWGVVCSPTLRSNEYTIQVDAEPAFTAPLSFTNILPESTTIQTISSLSPGTYYWRVIACNGALCSNYSETRAFQVTALTAWFQVEGGNIHVNQDSLPTAVQSYVPSTNYLINNSNLTSGILSVNSGAVVLGSGELSSTGWKTAASHFRASHYNFDDIKNAMTDPYTNWGTIDDDQVLTSAEFSTLLLSNINNFHWTAPTLVLDGNFVIPSGKKVVFLSDNPVTIGQNNPTSITLDSLSIADGRSALLFASRNSISLKGDVTRLDGIYISGGRFDTGTGMPELDSPLIVHGSIISYGDILLKRNLPSAQELTTPNEKVIYHPEFIVGLSNIIQRHRTKFIELSP